MADKDAVIEQLTARVAELEHTTRVLHRTPIPRPGIVGMLPTSHSVASLHSTMPEPRTDLPTASTHPLLHAPVIPVSTRPNVCNSFTPVAATAVATATQPSFRVSPLTYSSPPTDLLVSSSIVPVVSSVSVHGLSHITASPSVTHTTTPTAGTISLFPSDKVQRCGKAPPVEPSTGEDPQTRFEDWLPTLTRAATWNLWSDEECLMQLAGHLRGRASVEWNLLSSEEKLTFALATQALQARLDPGNRVLAAQDFRHAIQRDDE